MRLIILINSYQKKSVDLLQKHALQNLLFSYHRNFLDSLLISNEKIIRKAMGAHT